MIKVHLPMLPVGHLWISFSCLITPDDSLVHSNDHSVLIKLILLTRRHRLLDVLPDPVDRYIIQLLGLCLRYKVMEVS